MCRRLAEIAEADRADAGHLDFEAVEAFESEVQRTVEVARRLSFGLAELRALPFSVELHPKRSRRRNPEEERIGKLVPNWYPREDSTRDSRYEKGTPSTGFYSGGGIRTRDLLGYESGPLDRLDYVERGSKLFSRDRATWRSAGICGA